jgi:hypothetical protein
MASVLLACSSSTSPGQPEQQLNVRIASGPAQLRQGDVGQFSADVRSPDGSPAPGAAVSWSVQPSDAGLITADGRFVAYQAGTATVVATVSGGRADADVQVVSRDLSPASFRVVGQGAVDDRFTSDLWLLDQFAYTGTWGQRNTGTGINPGNRLYAWDVSDPASPRITSSVAVAAGTVNDVKIRSDGTLAVLTHESESPNGITLLDITDPLHPEPITHFTDFRLRPGVHNVWIEGDYVYDVVDGTNPTSGSGLQIIRVTDPANPEVMASFWGGTGTTLGQFLHDVYVRDGLAFLAHWNAGLIILDVGNGIAGGSPEHPVEVSRIIPEGRQAHNAWYWPEAGYVFVGEEDFSTPGIMHVIDASDLRNPKEVATYRVPGDTPHNFWLDEQQDILYLAWYTQGIRALDVSGQLLGELDRQGREIASLAYDGPGACASGSGTCTWAPQLHDGLVWVSDMNSGIWSLDLEF